MSSFAELIPRLEGLRRLKGDGALLTIGYETTACQDGEVVALAYRGSRFAILTSNSVTVWHNHSWLSQTFQRQLNKVLRPVGCVVVIRDGFPYLLDPETDRLTPFPTHETVTLTPKEGQTK